MALVPQDPMQGSVHFCLIQARWLGHSLLTRHSGLQFGGNPKNVGKQEHKGVLSAEGVHWVFGPHGEGLHGSSGGVAIYERKKSLDCVKIVTTAFEYHSFNWQRLYLLMGKQLTKGSPVYCGGHVQMGL